MPSYEAHGQTDVWHDRNWLMANLQRNHRDPIREASIIALQQLNQNEARDQVLSQRDYALEQRQQIADQHQANFEANQRRIMAHTGALELDRQLKMDRDTEIDEQGHGLLQSMMQLEAAKRRGEITKDQYDDGLLQAGQQFPLGTRHPEAARHYEFAISEADKQNAFDARREFSQAAKLGAKYGIGVQADPDTGLPSVAHTQAAALQTPKGKLEQLGQMNMEMAKKYGITTGVSSLFNPIQPHSSDDNGATINLPFINQKDGAIGKLPVPAPLFNQMKQDFNDRYFALIPQQNVSAQTAGAAPPTSSQAAPAVSLNQDQLIKVGVKPNQLPTIGSQQDYESLAPGSHFISNGQRYQKPAPVVRHSAEDVRTLPDWQADTAPAGVTIIPDQGQ